MRFNPKGDYKAEFEREVNELIEQNIEDRQERIKAIGALVSGIHTWNITKRGLYRGIVKQIP